MNAPNRSIGGKDEKSDKKHKVAHPPLNAPIGWRKGSDVSTTEAASFIRCVEFWNPRIDCLSKGVEVAVADDKARTAEGVKSLEAIAVLSLVLIWRRE